MVQHEIITADVSKPHRLRVSIHQLKNSSNVSANGGARYLFYLLKTG